MRLGLLVSFLFAALSTACAANEAYVPDQAMWNPPGQGDLEVADPKGAAPAPKKAPRARHVQTPNRGVGTTDNLKTRNALR
jgi:hypothetical protein